MDIAFIGLGHMGAPMASNLLKAGFPLSVFDLNKDAVAALAEQGAKGVDSLSELSDADVFITMLQTGEQVRSVTYGPEGFFHSAKPGVLHIDCSSIDVSASKEIHQNAKEHSLFSLDAPVSGGVMGAEKGTLTLMVGGEEGVLQKARVILEVLGQKIVHTGDAGTGQAAKICNNLILGISMAAISEAFALGEKLGLSPQKLFEVSSNASGQCWAMTSYCPVPDLLEGVPSNNGYLPGFSSQMMLKDLKLSQNAAKSTAFNSRLGARATEVYQQFVEQEEGADKDFSAIYTMYSK
jgi:3-hydroxyisobutyrate dehydrogenase